MRWIPAVLIGVLVVSTAGSARADATDEAGEAAVLEATERWDAALDHAVTAGRVLTGWVTTAAPALLDRAVAAVRVRFRDLLDRSHRLLETIASNANDLLHVPDLTILTAEPVKGVENSGFGWRVDPITEAKKFHKGTDYKADRGTPVYAAGDGRVVFTGRQKGYGKVIYLDHGGGLITRYAHLSKIGVDKGDTILGDTVIGAVGSTGRTTGPHLHFEIRIDGRAVDPVQGMTVGAMQRTHPGMAWLAAMALLPEVQKHSVDAHDPPPGMRKKSRRHRPSS